MNRVKSALLVLSFVAMVGFCLTIAGEGYGFGVDSNGYVYIGKNTHIEVFAEEKMIRTIELPPHRAYYFTVQADDTILFSNLDFYYVLDLNGEVLSRKPELESQIFNQLQMKKEVVTGRGERYTYQNFLGWEIIKNDDGETIYQTPIKNNLSVLIVSLMITCLCVPVIISIIQHRNNRNR